MRKIEHLGKVLLMGLLLTLIFTGCIHEGIHLETSMESRPEARQVTDQKGRTITIPTEVNRVVTTYLPATNIVFAVGGQTKLVGVNNKVHSNSFLTSIYPDIAQVDEIGNKEGINIETIVANEPDVVILYPVNDSEGICERLASQGIPSIIINPESIEQIKASILLIGDVLNRNKQAQELVAYYDRTLSLIDNRVSDIPIEDRKKIYLAGGRGLLSTSSKDMFQHYVIEKSGGIDVASGLIGGWNQISVEELIQWNPDILVAVQYCSDGMPEIIKENPQLQSLKAVKNNELYRFPSNLGPWDFPAPRSVLGILWLAKTTYPERFQDLDILKEIDAFHTQFYGKSFTTLGGRINDKGIFSKNKKE